MTTILTAAITGVAVLLAGSLPWAGFGPIVGLGRLNLQFWTAVPWAILPMAAYLWAYWRFIGGAWGTGAGAAERRANLRANRLPTDLWGVSLAAGMLGFGGLVAFLAVAARLVRLPSSAPITTPDGMPALTAFLLLVMASIVAGVTEEAAFRGYMQSMIERRYGVTLAILVNGWLFGLLHFGNHPGDVLLMLPYYVAVSAVYGGLTWAADSILPALVLHSGGDIVVLTRWWATGRPEWQVETTPPTLVWEGGVDAPFVMAVVAFVALAVFTALAYGAVRKLRERAATTEHVSAAAG
jgi:membrane protease YdiL (CAAX protease family)